MEARAQKTSDSNRSFARAESKTSFADGAIRSTSKDSSMIRRISRSLGAGLVVTKLPQTNTRRSFPVPSASSSNARNRLNSHTRRGVAMPKRDWNSCQPVTCTPNGNSPSGVNSGSTINTIPNCRASYFCFSFQRICRNMPIHTAASCASKCKRWSRRLTFSSISGECTYPASLSTRIVSPSSR